MIKNCVIECHEFMILHNYKVGQVYLYMKSNVFVNLIGMLQKPHAILVVTG